MHSTEFHLHGIVAGRVQKAGATGQKAQPRQNVQVCRLRRLQERGMVAAAQRGFTAMNK
jgi:hypothetical protein